MSPHQHHNRHLLAYSFAGVIGIAYYYWKNQKTKRKEGDKLALYSDSEWESLLLQMAGADGNLASTVGGGNNCIYLDYNGTTPTYPPVLAAMLPYFTTHYGNPSSGHAYGRHPRQAIDKARKTILMSSLGVQDNADLDLSAIWFTACGTESDNLAIQLSLQSSAHKFSGLGTHLTQHFHSHWKLDVEHYFFEDEPSF